MRITKEYDERRNEILNIAEGLFHLKGYDKCTVNDILKLVGIAKGTFYHYFKSKEEVLDAIISQYKEIVVNRAKEILISDISSEEKLMRAIMAMRLTNQIDDNMLSDMHKTDNALLHQKTLNQMVTAMAPILAMIIEEGIDQKVWSCKYPLQYMQIFLASALTLTDEGIFELDSDSQMKVIVALITLLEKMLDVPEDSFLQLYMQNQE